MQQVAIELLQASAINLSLSGALVLTNGCLEANIFAFGKLVKTAIAMGGCGVGSLTSARHLNRIIGSGDVGLIKRLECNLANSSLVYGPPMPWRCLLVVVSSRTLLNRTDVRRSKLPSLLLVRALDVNVAQRRLVEDAGHHGIWIVRLLLEVLHLLLVHTLLELGHVAL